VEDDLTFMAIRELAWAARSRFIQGCVALFEVSKGLLRDVGNFGDLTERMSLTLNQPQGSTSFFGGPLHHGKDVFELLSGNWGPIYNGGGGNMS